MAAARAPLLLFFALLLSAQPSWGRDLLQAQGPVAAPDASPTSTPSPNGTAALSTQGPPPAPASQPSGSPSASAPAPAVPPTTSAPNPASNPAPNPAPSQPSSAGTSSACPPNSNATAALASITVPILVAGSYVTLNVSNVPGVGISFLPANVTIAYLAGGPNLSRGLIIIPEDGVDPAAYAPYAMATAISGIFVVIVADSSYGAILGAMALAPNLQYWALAGHGRGGTVAASLVPVLYPKVKGLALLGATLPALLDLSGANVLVTSLYGLSDTVVPPASVRSDALRYPGDAVIKSYNLSHYDFAYSQCSGNDPGSTGGTALTAAVAADINVLFSLPIRLAQWAVATPRALSFGDNSLLTPGQNVSKPYPVNATGLVTFRDILIPGTLPPRHWYVFSPPANATRGGYIYMPGGAVDARAYFPVAFEIAARGWLTVIIQVNGRVGFAYNSTDAFALLNSTDPAFAAVPMKKWAIGGHSAGGQAAAAFVGAQPSAFFALIMEAGALAPVNFTTIPTPVVNIVGTLDRVSGPGISYLRYATAFVGPYANPNPNVTLPQVDIVGGSHYQHGDYGYQYDDDIATISQDQQQSQVAQQAVLYLDRFVPKP